MKLENLTSRWKAGAAGSVLLILSLSACGGSVESSTKGGLTEVNVGNQVYTGTAPFKLGVDKGFFKDEGLDIAITEGDSPAALGGQVTSGQLDVAFATSPFLATAVAQGTDLRAFASVDGVIDAENPSSGIVVKQDSEVKSLSDLSGKKVGIPGLGSLLHLVALADIDEQGGDASTVDIVQIPFPQMEQALETGNVDAIVPTEPFLSAVLSTGAKSLAGPEADIVPDASVTAWTASLRWLEDEPETARAFRKAMNRSIEYAKENQDELTEMMPEYTGLSQGQIEEMNFGTVLTTELNSESIAEQAKLLVKFGFIDEVPTREDMIYDLDG